MSEFKEPKLAISKVYTKTGDKGRTALVGGQRVPKSDARIECYGTIDELNSQLGVAIETLKTQQKDNPLLEVWITVQHQLFNLGSILATMPTDRGPKQPRVKPEDISWLEDSMDTYNESLPVLRSFVLPGGNKVSAFLHVCRTVCRRAERQLVGFGLDQSEDPELETFIQYLNRLSDAFFVWGRAVLYQLGHEEHLWQPNLGSKA